MFGKRINELDVSDIQCLIDEGVPESAEVEFKKTLPANKGEDPWLSGEGKIGDKARNEILEEVVAFANAHGGTVVLGIDESSEKPPRADAIIPLPKCVELAERLRMQCRDCIEPQIPLLDAQGVPTAEDGSGVVVIHVPSSRLAPHRHMPSLHCYTRRADRSEKMTMREIQDLTLQVERGLAAIEARFDEISSAFINQIPSYFKEAGFRVQATLIPMSPIRMERVYKNEDVLPRQIVLKGPIGGKGEYEFFVPQYGYDWRPIMRGTEIPLEERKFVETRRVMENGEIQYRLFVKYEDGDMPYRFYPSWLIGLLGNALLSAERFRLAAGAPEIEYGLSLGIYARGKQVPIGKYGGRDPGSIGELPVGLTVFPRYSVGPVEEFQKLIQIIEQDFWHAVGKDWADRIEIDFGTYL